LVTICRYIRVEGRSAGSPRPLTIKAFWLTDTWKRKIFTYLDRLWTALWWSRSLGLQFTCNYMQWGNFSSSPSISDIMEETKKTDRN